MGLVEGRQLAAVDAVRQVLKGRHLGARQADAAQPLVGRAQYVVRREAVRCARIERLDAAVDGGGRLVGKLLVDDRLYRRQRHVYDFTRKYYLLGRDRLIERLEPAAGEAVLEIGCGTARNLICAEQRYPQARFFGIDVSAAMLATAHDEIAREGLSARIRLARADATEFDPARLFGVPAFSRIFISYTLSMIPQWPRVLAEALRRLTPDGQLHIVDFGGQERLPRWFSWGLRRWLAAFHVWPRDRLEGALAVLALQAGALAVLERSYRGYAQYAVARKVA